MSKVHVIAMDTHSQTTDLCVKTRTDGPCRRWRVRTSIPEIVRVIEQVKGPREMVIEEGPLADWLLRNLKMHVDKAVACDPRKNALVAGGGGSDKDDAIDAEKLCDLYLGHYIKPVHHGESLSRQVAKQAVGLYHERVIHRVRSANKVMGLMKRWGMMVREKDFQDPDQREKLLGALRAESECQRQAAGHMQLLMRSYDAARAEEKQMHREVVKLAKAEEVVVRWEAVPGIGWIRGMTLLAYLDTPWRFKRKQALWKYMGIGLVRERSGSSDTRVHVPTGCNRLLKGTILGAAETVILQKAGAFYRRYERWMEAGMRFRNARRNVARDIAQTLWSMWKNGREFDERLIGGASALACEAGASGL
jgi:transposase